MALQPPWTAERKQSPAAKGQAKGHEAKGRGGDGVMGLIRTIIKEPLDLSPLRAHFSFELCGLLASTVSKDPSARPNLRDVLSHPLVKRTPGCESLVAQAGVNDRGLLGAAADWVGNLLGGGEEGGRADGDGGGVKAGSTADSDGQRVAAGSAQEGAGSGTRAAPTGALEVAAGTEMHAAAAVLQRSFHTKRRRRRS